MQRYPLAIYTAEHGLAWTYPRGAIAFEVLDACRKAFGPLPDFDLGEPGFEGVWATPEHVFAVCCQSAPAWDFRGRDATYLAVTWVPRGEAGCLNFEALLSASALHRPTHTPPADFSVAATCPPLPPLAPPQMLPEGFARVGAVIAGLPPDVSAVFRRPLGERAVQVRVVSPLRDAPQPFVPPKTPPPAITPPPVDGLLIPWPAALAALVLWVLTLALVGSLALEVWHLRKILSVTPGPDLWPCHCELCRPTSP